MAMEYDLISCAITVAVSRRQHNAWKQHPKSREDSEAESKGSSVLEITEDDTASGADAAARALEMTEETATTAQLMHGSTSGSGRAAETTAAATKWSMEGPQQIDFDPDCE
jgi:hypothetical protein